MAMNRPRMWDELPNVRCLVPGYVHSFGMFAGSEKEFLQCSEYLKKAGFDNQLSFNVAKYCYEMTILSAPKVEAVNHDDQAIAGIHEYPIDKPDCWL